MIADTKVIVTVGPSSFREDTVRRMDQLGVDVFRVNLSHTEIEDVAPRVRALQSWTSKAVCLDTEGAQLRTRLLPGGTTSVRQHDIVEFGGLGAAGAPVRIPLSFDDLPQILTVGDVLRIDFNSVAVQIIECSTRRVAGRVLQGGVIGSNKGVSVDSGRALPAFTEKDVAALKIGNELGIDTVAFSFAVSRDAVKACRGFFDHPVTVISKVESRLALHNLDDVIAASDAVLIDRGDLSREVPLEKIVYAQEHIVARAQVLKTPVYVATNLMESMIQQSKPTRAEVHDIVSTLKSGVDGLVLAAEVAIGQYPVECVKMLASIITEQRAVAAGAVGVDHLDYLFSLPSNRVIEPHGSVLVQQYWDHQDPAGLAGLASLSVSADNLSDIRQIAVGTFSPVDGFMSLEQLDEVLERQELNGVVWTMPILLQVVEEQARALPVGEPVALRGPDGGEIAAVMKVERVERVPSVEAVARKWFLTNDVRHPGVAGPDPFRWTG